MSVYLSTQKVIKDWIDYNDHMNVSYYLLMFDKYGADTLNNIFKMGEHSAKTNKKMPKGDPITLAEVSAVLGVKKTSELIPLCHPLPIDHTATKIIMNEVDNSLEVFCVVSAVAKTGVEMEAIMGVNAALITIYDLSKIVNPHLKIDNVKLLIKEGGKSGLWTNPDGLPEFLKNIF